MEEEMRRVIKTLDHRIKKTLRRLDRSFQKIDEDIDAIVDEKLCIYGDSDE